MPYVFVLMPFDEDFNDIYELFVKAEMKRAGFSVDRADDIESQQNILRDILERIDKSDLIVADLTNSNPNVFYELGLAHALKKPVILITQSVDDVPFDLKSYRLLEYRTHFSKIEKAKTQLFNYAKGFLEGSMSFGSPVTDFLQDVPRQNKAIEPIPPDISREDERGFLDHLIDVTDGYSRIAGIAEGITEDLSVMNGATHASTKDLEKINANPSESSPRAARKIARKLAEHIARFKNRLKIANAEYASIAQDTENSLEFMLSFQLNQSEVINPEIHKQLSSLRNLLSTVIGARNSCLGMAEKMDEVPRIERRLNRELGQGSEEIRVMANNLDKTIASISRALNLHA